MGIMTVGDLKELLESVDDDVKIKLALQPNYPMRGSIQNLCVQHTGDGDVVWLACSGNQSYDVPHDAWGESEIFEDDDEEGGVE